jgi:hypothetical protein
MGVPYPPTDEPKKEVRVNMKPVHARALYLHRGLFVMGGADGKEWQFNTTIPPTALIMRLPDGTRWILSLEDLANAMIEATS